MKNAARVTQTYRVPLTALIVSLAVSVFAQTKPEAKIARIQKPRVVARGHFSGTRAVQQILVWQTANPSGGMLPYAKAYLAIEAVDRNSYTLFQADGGETQYLVDAIQVADLDGDGIQEILSLWWEGASAGAVLRIFHYDKSGKAFVELKSDDDLGGVHRYRLDAARPKTNRRIAIYSRTGPFTGTRQEYELRDAKIVPVKKAGGEKTVNKTEQRESGIEGQSFIGPTRPHIRLGDSTPDVVPYKSSLLILAVNDNREVARLETGADGRFRVALPPGDYLLRPLNDQGKRLPVADEQTVTVVAGQFVRVKINFDSGMR
jgi:hypothetical protein